MPNYKLFQFKIAYKYLKLGAEFSRKFDSKRDVPLWIQFALQVDRLIYRDRYASEHFDTVIFGGDPVVGMLAAIRLAKSGKRVLVYPNMQSDMPSEYYEICHKRFSMFIQGFSRLAGLQGTCVDINEFVKAICDEAFGMVSDNGQPLVYVADLSCEFVTPPSGKDGGVQEFWVESCVSRSESNMLWDYVRSNSHSFSVMYKDVGFLRWHGETSPKCLLTTNSLVLTSYLGENFPSYFQCHTDVLSEAAKSILSFDQFNINDRIVDIVELAKLG